MSKDRSSPSAGDPALLRMVESKGRYSDRQVTYFRVFDPALATQRSVDVRQFRDLDDAQALIVRSGHVERDGVVVLTRPVVVHPATTPIRSLADQSQHGADAQTVVHGVTRAAANSGTSEAPQP